MDIRGRAAVVTGGAVGTGRAIACRLAAEGASVVLADIDAAGCAHTEQLITEAGGRAATILTDLRSRHDIHAMIEFARSRLGGLHILVNNAGGSGHLEPNFTSALDGVARAMQRPGQRCGDGLDGHRPRLRRTCRTDPPAASNQTHPDRAHSPHRRGGAPHPRRGDVRLQPCAAPRRAHTPTSMTHPLRSPCHLAGPGAIPRAGPRPAVLVTTVEEINTVSAEAGKNNESIPLR